MSRHQETGTVLRIALAGALACGLAACGGKNEGQDGGPAAATAARTAKPVEAISAKVAAMSVDQLREAATKAVAEQRIYAPAGDNAMEYYLALRDKAPGDAAVSSALTDLQPYTLIATEQGIARDDFVEAQRLYALLEKTDSKAPALPRLKASIADAEKTYAQRQQDAQTAEVDDAKRAELEKERLAEQRKMQEEAAKQIQAKQAEERRIADARTAEQQRQQQQQQAAAREAEERQRQQAQEAERRAATPPRQTAAAPEPAAAAPARAASNELREVRIVQPRYPAAALRSRQSGNVQVEFTVGTDGEVTSARVVNADPPRVFNSEALAAVKRWRFQPVASPVTTRRTINFTPAN